MSTSQWYVITGPFCSGKTTLIRALASQGYAVVPEAARLLIDEDMAAGRTIEEIRRNEAVFERRLLARKLRLEVSLPLETRFFLDRGMPDSIAYHRFIGLDPETAVTACRIGLYRGVFLLDPLPMVRDYARTESEADRVALHALLRDAYLDLGYEVVPVPPLPVEERLRFVLERL